MFDFKIKGAPTIELNYGGSQMHLKSITNKFAKPGLLELKLGYTTDKSYNGSDYVSKYNFNFFHISNSQQIFQETRIAPILLRIHGDLVWDGPRDSGMILVTVSKLLLTVRVHLTGRW